MAWVKERSRITRRKARQTREKHTKEFIKRVDNNRRILKEKSNETVNQ